MNIDIYKKLNEVPLLMKCPGLDTAKASQDGINDVISKLRLLGLDISNNVDIELITNVEQKLNLSISAMDRNMGYMQSLADDAIWLSSKTNLVSSLDDMAGLPVSDCVNTSSLFAPITGGASILYNAASELSNNITQQIVDFLAGASDAAALNTYLGTLSEIIDAMTAPFDAMIDEGKALLNALEQKIMNSAIAGSISSVWNNPCTQGILGATLPDEIKDML